MKPSSRIAIFASGSGTNAEKIFNYFQNHPSIHVGLLLTNNPEAYALVRAKKFGVNTMIFNKSQFHNSDEVVNRLQQDAISHIVLAGFLWLVPQNLLRVFANRIVNIHPALLPKYGGKGMYGMKVHEAVRNSGDKETGITIHEVNERYDEGKILFQARCEVLASDSADQIADKVHGLEHAHYPRVIEKWITG